MWPFNRKPKVQLSPENVPDKGQPASTCCGSKIFLKKHPIFARKHLVCGQCFRIVAQWTGKPVEPEQFFPRTPEF